jgi:trimeric autotransporter adhesin
MISFRRWLTLAGVLAFSSGLLDAQPQYLISTFAGGVPAPTAGVATSYPIGSVNAVATDRFGNTYASTNLNCVFKLNSSGAIERVAGNGQSGFSGDGGNALNAQLNNPQGIAVDTAGNLYIADQNNQRVRMVNIAGNITTVAGTGTAGYNGDSQLAINAQLNYPLGLATDVSGNLYIADQLNQRIREISGGTITTVAGTGVTGRSGDGGPATSATLTQPQAVVLDAYGQLYVADESNQVRVVNPSGVILHFAGTGLPNYSGDSGLAAGAALSGPVGLAVDPAGNLYIADEFNLRVRKVDVYGIITTFAGGNSNVVLGDGGPANSAHLYNPTGVSADTNGNIFIAEQDFRIREVNSAGIISTAAGTGAAQFGGDGGPASLAQFSSPRSIARDGSGNLYVADLGNDRVRLIAPGGTISTFAGNGTCCNLVNGEAATSASIVANSVAVDQAGNVYVGDIASVAKVSTTGGNSGSITAVAGSGIPGNTGIPGPALNARLSATIPGIALDHTNNLYLSDLTFQRVLEVNSGNISAVAGDGNGTYTGDGGLGTSESLNFPGPLAFDSGGVNLYIADTQNNRVRQLVPAGTISTVAGDGSGVDSGDNGPATAAGIAAVEAVTVDGSGNLFIATGSNKIRMVLSGTIYTIAGNGNPTYSGDGGLAISASLSNPSCVLTDASGNVFVCDSANNAIRVLQVSGTAPVFTISTTQGGPFTTAQIGATYSVVVSNVAQAGPVNGQITVTEIVPSGLQLVSMSGVGWACPSNGNVCRRSDQPSIGNQYPAITIVVNVNGGAPPQVTNVVTVSGGGSLGAVSSTATFIGLTVPSLQISATGSGAFIAGENVMYSVTVGNQSEAAATNSTVTVTEGLPSTGLSLLSMTGNGWTCSSNSCSRSDPLPGGSGYPAISVLAAVSPSAPSRVTNMATVSGGGATTASTSVTTPVTAISCNIAGSTSPTVTNVQVLINQALGFGAALDDLNQDGAVNVTDVQIEINAILGSTCLL